MWWILGATSTPQTTQTGPDWPKRYKTGQTNQDDPNNGTQGRRGCPPVQAGLQCGGAHQLINARGRQASGARAWRQSAPMEVTYVHSSRRACCTPPEAGQSYALPPWPSIVPSWPCQLAGDLHGAHSNKGLGVGHAAGGPAAKGPPRGQRQDRAPLGVGGSDPPGQQRPRDWHTDDAARPSYV